MGKMVNLGGRLWVLHVKILEYDSNDFDYTEYT